MKTIIPLFLGALLGLVILIEVGLRLVFGFGTRPIFIADPEIGYLFAPNQKVKRFGKRIFINEYSHRSDPFNPQRDENTLRILMLGDSILNGNWWTDQKDILSELIEQKLDSPKFAKIEVLNASANSWGPRNQLAYLKRFGTFESQIVILVMNPDDFYARQPTDIVVGNDVNYPDRQPFSAIGEVIEEAFFRLPKLKIPREQGGVMRRNFNAMTEMKNMTDEANGQFMVVITPLLRELDEKKGRKQEKNGRNRLERWIAEEKSNLVDVLPQFNSVEDPSTLYRDHIHLSSLGDQMVADIIVSAIEKEIENLK